MYKMITNNKGQYSLINADRNSIEEVIYDDIKEFSSGYVGVCVEGKWGYFDEKGRQIIDFLYHDVKDFSEKGFAPVKVNEKNNSWRVLKENGELMNSDSEYGYTYMSEFNSSGYAVVKETHFYYLMDEMGRNVDHHHYSNLEYIESKDVYLGMRQGKSCFINKSKKIIVDPDDYYDDIYFPVNGLAMVNKGDKYGYINEDGQLVIPLHYTNVTEFSDNGMAYVETEEGLGAYIDRKGAFVIEPSFDSGTPFEHGMAAVSKAGKYYYIYENGTKSINAEFKFAGAFSECGLAKVVMFDGTIRFIRPDSSIAYTLADKDADVDEYQGNRTISQFRLKGKVGLIDDGGETIVPAIYDEIEISPYSTLHTYLDGDNRGYIDDAGCHYKEEGKIILDQNDDQVNSNIIRPDLSKNEGEFARIYGFDKGMALAIKRDEPVFLNGEGQELNRINEKDERILLNKRGQELNRENAKKELMALLPIRFIRSIIENESKGANSL